jgi:D-serine deaminase-like pyridoxal phosphate-dependent protein
MERGFHQALPVGQRGQSLLHGVHPRRGDVALDDADSLTPGKWGVLDAGLKAFGMDHGDPRVLDVGDCWFVSDEHITFGLADGASVAVGDRVRVIPAHVDPTVSQHERLHLVDGDDVIEVWDIDLRGW